MTHGILIIVLITEVSVIQRFVIERFHCITFRSIIINILHVI